MSKPFLQLVFQNFTSYFIVVPSLYGSHEKKKSFSLCTEAQLLEYTYSD